MYSFPLSLAHSLSVGWLLLGCTGRVDEDVTLMEIKVHSLHGGGMGFRGMAIARDVFFFTIVHRMSNTTLLLRLLLLLPLRRPLPHFWALFCPSVRSVPSMVLCITQNRTARALLGMLNGHPSLTV